MEHIQNRMASTPKPHTFDQRSWKAIKDFVGIYNIDMDYTKIGKLTKKKLSNAYFKHGKLSRRPFETEFQYIITYDEYGRMKEADTYRGAQNISNKEWKKFFLKQVAQGNKNRRLYEALSKNLKGM